MEPQSTRLIFEQEGVYLHTNADSSNQDTSIPGFIRIMERDGEPALEWCPLNDARLRTPIVLDPKENGEGGEEATDFDPGYESDWAVITMGKRDGKERVPVADERSFSLPVSELHSLRRLWFTFGRNFLLLTSKGGHPLPPLYFHRGGTRALLQALGRYVILSPSPCDARVFFACPHDSGTLSQSFDGDYVIIFDDGSSSRVLNAVTSLFRGYVCPPESPPNQEPDPNVQSSSDEESGCELSATRGPRLEATRGYPLEQWAEFLDDEGRVQNPERVRELVFRGGIAPNLRKDVWKFLLGFYPWNSTVKEREDILREKTDDYFRMKMQWKSVSEEQKKRNSLLSGYRSLIDKDVSRTDTHNSFFSGDDNPVRTLLSDILTTYCMYNFDLGYVQGISDLLAPLVFVLKDEVESFWCLTGFMELVERNFEESQEGMKQQFLQLSILLKALDPELCDYLDSQDSGSIPLCFCFRWLVIWFKREFYFEDILTLWEVMWTRLPCENFHLLIACSILESQRGELIGSEHDCDTILKHINDLTMKLDLQTVLREAEEAYLKLVNCKELKVQEVLGLYVPSSSEEESSS